MDVQEKTIDELIDALHYGTPGFKNIVEEEIRRRLVENVDKNMDSRIFLLWAMTLFSLTKIAALLCAVYLALQVNMWLGAAAFLFALIYRITWTYLPNPEKKEN